MSRGDTRWVGDPGLHHAQVLPHRASSCAPTSGIEVPADLRGKRVGVPEYQQTAAIWSRGILQHEFDVHARDIEWFMERKPDKSHGGATGFTPPPGVRVNQIPPTTNIGEMLIRGELDGSLHYLADNNLVDRSRVDVSGVTRYAVSRSGRRRPPLLRQDRTVSDQPHRGGAALAAGEPSLDRAQPLFRLRRGEGGDRARREIVSAVVFRKRIARRRRQAHAREHDPLAYGFKAARPVLETVAQYVHEQGLRARRVELKEIFAPSTLDV